MTEAKLIRVCLLGLPIGLVLLTAGSMAVHFSRPKEEGPPKIIRALADEITPGELQGYVRNLSEVIGPRHLSQPDTLERTANYIESTLGPRNIGYQTHKQEFDAGNAIYRNVWVQIPGGKRADEVVIVVANYDSEAGSRGVNSNASGIAALLALAQNFVDEDPKRTIRLVALTNGTAPADSSASGAARYAQAIADRGDKVVAVLCMDGLGAFRDQAVAYPGNLADYLSATGKRLAVIGVSSRASLVQQSVKSLQSQLQVETQGVVLDGEDRLLLNDTIAQPFNDADMPTLWIRSNGSFGVRPDKDTMDGVDWEAYTSVVKGLATTIRQLSNP